ncbi:hypothetical protein HUT16_30665 [Kitasatospora sp. NA04385]|nr:hypothetical protein HUT16_30665 [Kitasatospora sp. NA04385]
MAEAVAARVVRSDGVVRDGERRFAVLVEESVPRNRVGGSETTAGQLGYLLALMSLPRVSLGVVPLTARREMWTWEAFNVFDDQRVHVELLTAAVTVTAPPEPQGAGAALDPAPGAAAVLAHARLRSSRTPGCGGGLATSARRRPDRRPRRNPRSA